MSARDKGSKPNLGQEGGHSSEAADNLPAIAIRRLSKAYEIYERPIDRLKQTLWRGRRQFYREFWALRDVSFSVQRGETVGIIGRNGAGKSTLLQVLAGTLAPSSGEVEVNGRVAALLELGSGFRPDFTGRENVYMNAMLLGLDRREIDERFDAVAAFADIGDFLDQPVRTYSSGMLMRLAFAVSVSVEPEILIIDEALAVGDMAFQAKCYERLARLTDSGATLLLVSHDLGTIKAHCRSVAYLKQGELRGFGSAPEVTEKYIMDLRDEDRRGAPLGQGIRAKTPLGSEGAVAFGTDQGAVIDAVFSDTGSRQASCATGDLIQVTLEVEYDATVKRPSASVIICDHRMIEVSGRYFELPHSDRDPGGTRRKLRFSLEAPFNRGNYFLTVRLEDRVAEANFVPIDKQVAALVLSVVRPPRHQFIGMVDTGIVVEREPAPGVAVFQQQHRRSILFITLDSCRYDTFEAARAPHLKVVGPLHRAMAPSYFTYGSHAAMFMGFTPGIAEVAVPHLNPKFAKLFKLVGAGHGGKGGEFKSLEGRSIIDGLRRAGYFTVGAAAVGWFNPGSLTGRQLTRDFDRFFFAADTAGLRRQLAWLKDELSPERPVFAFLNIGETHVPYHYEGAPWDASWNPCIPFGTANDAAECRRRQIACLEHVDAALAPLLDAFAQGTIVVCADHGDCWGEDGLWEHGFHHPRVLEVPLLFRLADHLGEPSQT